MPPRPAPKKDSKGHFQMDPDNIPQGDSVRRNVDKAKNILIERCKRPEDVEAVKGWAQPIKDAIAVNWHRWSDAQKKRAGMNSRDCISRAKDPVPIPMTLEQFLQGVETSDFADPSYVPSADLTDARTFRSNKRPVPQEKSVYRRLREVQILLFERYSPQFAEAWYRPVSNYVCTGWEGFDDQQKRQANLSALECRREASREDGLVMTSDEFVRTVKAARSTESQQSVNSADSTYEAAAAQPLARQKESSNLRSPTLRVPSSLRHSAQYHDYIPDHTSRNLPVDTPSLTATAGPDPSHRPFPPMDDLYNQHSLSKRTAPRVELSNRHGPPPRYESQLQGRTRYETADPNGVVLLDTVKRKLIAIRKELRDAGYPGADDWYKAVWPVVKRDWNSWTDDAKKRANALTLACRRTAKEGRVLDPELFFQGVHTEDLQEDAQGHYYVGIGESHHVPVVRPPSSSLTATAVTKVDPFKQPFPPTDDLYNQHSLSKRATPPIDLSYGAARAHGINREQWRRRMERLL